MLDSALSVLAPHPCFECGLLGRPLCSNCKYDIINDAFSGCVVCGRASVAGVCLRHHVSYDRAWVVGERRDTLQLLIGALKFQNTKAAAKILAELLDACLPEFPAGVVLAPLPTVAGHIRERGYDHALLIAKRLGRLRRVPVRQLLTRQTKTVQHRADRAERLRQAAAAFGMSGEIDPGSTYVIIDDIITTGASVEYAARTLKQAGAQQVWVAAVARQPLDSAKG